MKKIAFIGIGQMGSGMSQRLIEQGFDVLGYDISEQSRQAAQALGISTTAVLAEALTDRHIILTSLPNAAIALDVWLGPNGILNQAEQGSIGIDLSTIDPESMRQIARAGSAKGIDILDAPVSGGPGETITGKLVVMVGGNQTSIAQMDDVLKALSSSYHYTGEVGTAKAVKLVNNMMSMGNIVVAAEAFALGLAAGVSPELLYSVLSQSGGTSHHFTKRFPKAIKNDFAPGFKLELGEKDLALAIEFGRTLQHPTPAASSIRELMAMGLAAGYRGQDVVAMLDFYNRAHT